MKTNIRLLLSIVLFSLLAAFPAWATYNVPLQSGWNLVSLPEQPVDNDIAAVTASIAGQFDAIWTYEDGRWRGYFPTLPGFSDLETINAGRAYWIKMSSPGTLTGESRPASSILNLDEGWNFMGVNGGTDWNVADVFQDFSDGEQILWGLDSGNWVWYDSTRPADGQLQTLRSGKGYWVRVTGEAAADYGIQLAANANVLTQTESDQITEFTGDTVVFSIAQSYQVGDIIAGKPSAAVPYGFLKRVTGIRQVGGDTVYDVEDAALTELVESGTLQTVQPILFNVDELNAQAPRGIRVKAARVKYEGELAEAIEISIDVRYYDPGTGMDCTITGRVYLRPEADFYINFGFPEIVEEMHFVVKTREEVELSATFAATGEIEKSWRLLGPFHAGGILVGPVLIVPEFTVNVTASGKVSLGVTASVEQWSDLRAGVAYNGTDGLFAYPPEFDFGLDFGLAAELSGRVKISAGPDVNLLLYGLAGPKIGLHAYGEIIGQWDMGAGDLSWGLYGGLEMPIGLAPNALVEDALDELFELCPFLGAYRNWTIDLELYRTKLYPDNQPPVLAGDLTVSDITSSNATVSWPEAFDNDDDTVYYYVDYRQTGNANWTEATPLGTLDLSHVLNGLSADTGYDVRVTPEDIEGQAGNSLTASFTTQEGGGVIEGLALIPAGEFQMGDNLGDGSSNELPVHTVYVSAFYMGVTEVTYGQWKDVYNWATSHGYSFSHAGSGKADNHPVHTISWYDMVTWCNAKSEMESLQQCYNLSDWTCDFGKSGYRLPTEAEWEKAARGGLEGQRYPWGNDIDCTNANYYGCVGSSTPVGDYAANGYGLYDMAGNVWEWCWDWYASGYYDISPGTDPTGPVSGSIRVYRGGCWNFNAFYARCANRDFINPSSTHNIIGFRVVRRSD